MESLRNKSSLGKGSAVFVFGQGGVARMEQQALQIYTNYSETGGSGSY